MKSAISRHNQSGLKLDDEAVRTIQAASRPDWNPSEQLVLVTIPDVSQQTTTLTSRELTVSADTSSLPFDSVQRMDWMSSAKAEAPQAVTPPLMATSSRAVEVVPLGREIPGGAPGSAEQDQAMGSTKAELTSTARETSVTSAVASPVSHVETAVVEPTRTAGHSAIVESLLARFGSGPSCLIHFCDIDQPQRAAEVCLSIGLEFADRTQRRVLLLDLSRTTRPLSCLLGVELAAGFREVIRTQLNWRHLVRPTSNPLVDVLPAGVLKLNSTATRADYELAVRRMAGELVLHYGGVYSCSDTAFDLETELVGLCSSGGFLTMDFQRTSRRLAKSAANHLQMSGTRLLGCIAASNSN